jgi:hypothetical protein
MHIRKYLENKKPETREIEIRDLRADCWRDEAFLFLNHKSKIGNLKSLWASLPD